VRHPWGTAILRRIRRLAAERKVRFTLKSFQELARLGMGLDEDDACDVLANLRPKDVVGRLVSDKTGEWMYVFNPSVCGSELYLKVALRGGFVVISLHEQEDGDEDG